MILQKSVTFVTPFSITKINSPLFSIFTRSKSSSSNRWIQRQKNDPFTREAKHLNYKSRAAFKLLQIDERFNIFKKSNGRLINVLDLGAAPGAWNQVAVDRTSKGSKIIGVDILPYSPPAGASSIQGNILSKGTHKIIRESFLLEEREKQKQIFQDIEIKIGTDEFTTLSGGEESLIEKEMKVNSLENDINKNFKSLADTNEKNMYPVDVVLSDMYVPVVQVNGFGNATTNMPYYRMANTTGLVVKDHLMSMDLCDAALITAIDLLKKRGSLIMKFFTGEEDKLLESRLKKVFNKVIRFKPKSCRLESKECYFVCLDKKDNFLDKIDVFMAK